MYYLSWEHMWDPIDPIEQSFPTQHSHHMTIYLRHTRIICNSKFPSFTARQKKWSDTTLVYSIMLLQRQTLLSSQHPLICNSFVHEFLNQFLHPILPQGFGASFLILADTIMTCKVLLGLLPPGIFFHLSYKTIVLTKF